ncbi:TRAP transporter small permease [Poseidonocella sedimentorum]|uniref:TRAP transporter small permease protein n=1 Tax=Poseidonocella sedimentorum TaxID=871652 RepID=A0A1I6DLW9_9RHOB|nr:TRAP transporter small permease [Poseidonocella sedimentorum]SFR06455.1 TRAP-type C4-dicarboxylate transport system, small permease component [Poseidonocella sedimentorum]
MQDPELPVFLRVMDQCYDLIARLCQIIAGTALVVMTGIFAWLVFGRYVLNDTPTWVEQVSLLLVMVIAFFGAAVGVREHTHLSVIIFRNMVPAPVRLGMVILSDLLMLIFGALMFWYGWELTLFKWKALIPLIQWSEGLRSLPMTIAGVLLFLFSAGHLIRVLLGRDTRQDTFEQG